MISVLNEITKLRDSGSLTINYNNTNRYRVLINETNGTKTAYYFSAPIYNCKSRKAVDMKFYKKDGAVYSVGSNAYITYSNHIRMENTEGYCTISLEQPVSLVSGGELICGKDRVYPTTNGFMYKAACNAVNPICFDLEVGTPFMEIRANAKYFSLMRERFRPFVTVSCIGTLKTDGEIIAPAKISFQKFTDRKYRLTITPCSPLGGWVLFEANLYESKLIQDTTVESANPEVNNAFGGTAFIGNTAEFGEQWLYSRPDYSKFSELTDRQIIKAVLHLPKLNRSNVQMSAFRVSSRFCSFGSNWNNKIAESSAVAESAAEGRYHNIDITPVFADKFGRFTQTEGIILKPRVKGGGFTAASTGDSSYAPQIYEINYR